MGLPGISFDKGGKKEVAGKKISAVTTSSIMGHYGNGMFPLTLLPAYRRFCRVAKECEVTNFPKSSTADRRAGNFILKKPWTWKYVRKIGDRGMLNSYGLSNDGAPANAPKIDRAIRQGYKVIPNLYPQFAKGLLTAVDEIMSAIRTLRSELLLDFWALELNYSCANSKEAISKNMEDANFCTNEIHGQYPNLILIVKISYVHPYEFAQEQIKLGASVIHAINAIHHDIVYPGQTSPLSQVGGGAVSCKPIFPYSHSYNKGLRKKIKAPIIMAGGISRLKDAQRFFDIGADAISFCSIIRLDPKEAEKIILKFN
ncbi:MAG: hypothetical protein Q8O93_02445 [bacterium]|nr:hypothetical protein [bacterium]